MTRTPALIALLLVTSTLALAPSAGAADPPTISGVDPATGSSNGGQQITIDGSNFLEGAVVEIGTASEIGAIPAPPQFRATNVTVTTGTTGKVTATVPPHAPGEVVVRVRNPDGQAMEFSGLFSYTQAPTPAVSSVTPSVVNSNGGATVTVNGQNFDAKVRNPVVLFGGIPAVVLSVTGTQISAVAPGNTPGIVSVSVQFPGAPVSTGCTGCFQYAASARPTVLSVSPSTGPKAGGTLVTITGTDFAPGSQVVFDDNSQPFAPEEFAAQVIYSSPTQITALSPALPAGAAAQARIRVINPGALGPDGLVAAPTGSHVSSETNILFNYNAAVSAPTLASASPGRGPPAGGTVVTLTGTNFHAGANEEPLVLVSPASGTPCSATGQELAYVRSRTDKAIEVEMPPLAAGSADIRVINPDVTANAGTVCKEDAFTYVAPLAIHSLSAVQGPTAGGTSDTPGSGILELKGEGFAAGMTVSFVLNGVATQGLVGPFTGSTSATVTPPPHVKGDTTVVVTTPDGRSATFFKYTYAESPAPTLASVSGAPKSNGGETLTITGTGFHFGFDPDGAGPLLAAKPKVKVGTVDVPAADVLGSPGVVTSFTVNAPAQAHGSISPSPKLFDVTVENPDGRKVASDTSAATTDQASYTKSAAPEATSLSDTAGPTYGGTLVAITGTGFATQGARPTVTVGGTAATIVGTPTATGITVLTPPLSGVAASADKDVKVTNPDGQEVTLSDNAKDFDYEAPGTPTVTTFTPTSGLALGGTVVTISGANLGSTTVDSAGTSCSGAPGGVPTPASFDGTKAAGTLPAVTVGGKPAKVVCLVDDATDTLVVVTPPTLGTGSVAVVVTPAHGTAVTASQTFGYNGAAGPTLTNPSGEVVIPATGGVVRTFAGTGFGPVTRDLDGRACGAAGFDKTKLATPVPTVRFIGAGETTTAPSGTDVCVREVADGPDTDSNPDVVLDVLAPKHAAGSVSIQVLNPDGLGASMGGRVRYLPLPPILTAVANPTSATMNGGAAPTLTVVNMPSSPLPAVLVRDTATGQGSSPAEVVSATSSGTDPVTTTVVARVPPFLPAQADVLAVDQDGQTGTLADALGYGPTAAPVFDSVSVRTGSLNGGTNVTLTGSGFSRWALVDFGGYLLEGIAWGDGKQLSFLTPNFMQLPPEGRRLSPVDVVVFNQIGLQDNDDLECPGSPAIVATGPPVQTLTNHCLVLNDLFGYSTVVSPFITDINPKSGGQGTTVTITGTNFASGSTVRFGNTLASEVSFVSATQLTAKAPQGTGVVSVTVTSGTQSHTLAAAFTYTATSSSSSSTSATSTTSRSSTSSSSGTTTGSTSITPADILEANQRISVEVTRDGDANVVGWELPTTGLPGTVAGVQVWGSNSPYSLLQTCASGSACFTAAEFRHTGAQAQAGTEYLVTMFYGTSEALGFYTQSNAPDTAVYPGTSSEDSGGPQDGDDGGKGGLPNWAIVLIVLGVLFLIVLVAILIARGRNRGPRQQVATQGYAWEETPAAEAQAADAEWDGGAKPAGEVHQARCPACATSFTATGSKPIVTVCPGCGKKGILR